MYGQRPRYDPASPPEISEDDVTMNGAYINRFLPPHSFLAPLLS